MCVRQRLEKEKEKGRKKDREKELDGWKLLSKMLEDVCEKGVCMCVREKGLMEIGKPLSLVVSSMIIYNGLSPILHSPWLMR